MYNIKRVVTSSLALISLLTPGCLFGQAGVPNVDAANQTAVQAESHFLTFLESFIPETPTSATAYYNAIDPGQNKRTFTKWLVNAGFIQNESEWNPTGSQITVTGSSHGHGQINAAAHVIVLNAADLGFVRNQYVRCVPSCTAKNPMIYTYLENYPVAPFAVGGSNFGSPGGSSYPTQAEATAAINSALTRPVGTLNGKSIARIADVAFEWAPPASNLTSSTRFGQLYAFIFHQDWTTATTISETIAWPNDAKFLAGYNNRADNAFPPINAATGLRTTLNAGDPFAPELDGRGFKQMPGVCFICHGGRPANLSSGGVYPRQGNVPGFRFLPLDVKNLLFTSDSGPEPTSRASQEASIKVYNEAVLLTVASNPQRDDQGIVRPPHLAEVIQGWYAPNMSSAKQDSEFLPLGWREPAHGGTAPPHSEDLYRTVVAPSCRSCHFNRELSLDFGTYENFKQESDLLELTLIGQCKSNRPDPNAKFMPLAHLTFQRFWQANNAPQFLPTNPPFEIFDTAEQTANYFGFAGTAGYCGSHP